MKKILLVFVLALFSSSFTACTNELEEDAQRLEQQEITLIDPCELDPEGCDDDDDEEVGG